MLGMLSGRRPQGFPLRCGFGVITTYSIYGGRGFFPSVGGESFFKAYIGFGHWGWGNGYGR